MAVMLLEIWAALGDELAYTQDRYAREAYLGTATQRRSRSAVCLAPRPSSRVSASSRASRVLAQALRRICVGSA